MSATNCPNCGQCVTSHIRKALMPPAKKFDCPGCGMCIGLSVGSSLTFMFIAIGLVKLLESFGLSIWLAFSAGVIGILLIQAFYIPLVIKERNSGVDWGL